MGTLEQVLLARAQEEAQARPTLAQSASAGAGAGALGGLALGGGIKGRMAGGLVGMILGGGLGAGARAMLTETSDAGRLLAKIQMGTMTDVDKYALENILAQTYSR